MTSIQSSRVVRTDAIRMGIFVAIAVVVALAAFSNALGELVARWMRQEEYSQRFLIPLISAWMLWARRDALIASIGRPSWAGPLLILFAIVTHLVGEFSSFYLLSQLSFIAVLFGIVLCIGGYSLLRVAFIPIAFLIYSLPLPPFLYSPFSLF